MNRHRIFAVAAIGLCAALWTYACGDGATEPPTPPPDPPRPATVAVAPATVRLTALGATEQLTVEVRDQNGNAMTGAAVSWASSAAAVATVSASGLVTAIANGTATITATAGSASGSATVTVAQEVSAVAVTPAADTVVAGDTLRLTAEAADANGHPVPGAEFIWASSDTLIAVVDDAGFVTGVGAGEAEVAATTAGVTGRAALTVVAPAPTTVEVTPDTVALTALGQTAQLTVEVRDQIERVMEGVPVSWSSADTTIAAIDPTGQVTAIGGGATTVVATAGGVSGTAVVKVMQSAGSVFVSPEADTVALGDTLRLAAEAFDENGHPVEGAEFGWSSSDVSVATVDGGGLVTGVAEGTATIAAEAGSGRGTAQITVENPDRAALVALYNATDGTNWLNDDNWLTDAPLRDWYGVDADAFGRVVRLDLGGQWDSEAGEYVHHGLKGPIPPELGNLTNLRYLDLVANHLTHPIPPELGNLVNLRHLDFAFNQLDGAIPPALGNLVDLGHLDLGANRLAGPIPAELGNLATLTSLWLVDNRLTGPIPPELGNLANLGWLDVGFNELTGPIPQSFLQLDRLRGFFIQGIKNLCVPGTASFVAWLQGIENRVPSENLCNAADVTALNSLFDAAGGGGWTASDGWAGDGAVEEWYGVSADSLGHVTELDLTRNGLVGRLPATLGDLTQMTTLRIGANALSGRLPLSLSQVPLREFHYADTDLCVPAKESFRAWLNAIPSHGGTGVECAPVIPTHLSVDPPSLAPAEAGKQGRETIYVTVTDAEGIPVADVGYRWTTDRNSGWVFPAEGKTSAQGLFSATWVAGSPGNGILVPTVGEGPSTLTVELETQSFAPAHPPWGGSVVSLYNSPRGTGYSIELTPLAEPHQTYYAAINWDGAYTGLQRGGHVFERSLIFCMFDPPGGRPTRIIRHAEDAFCESFGHQGTGMECHLNYPWQVGTTYRFEVTEQEMDGGSAMTVHVTNLVTGERRFVATMLYGARPDLRSFASFVEDFQRTAPTCLAQPVRSAAIRRAMVRINGVWESITQGFFERDDDAGNPGTGPCLNVAARDHASGLEIAIGGRTAMDPNISQVTIPP